MAICPRTETYLDVENLLWERVWSFVAKYGNRYGTPDDLFSDLCVAFVRCYDSYEIESEASFISYLHFRLDGALKDRVRRLHRRKETIIERNSTDEDGEPVDHRQNRWQQILSELSEDAKIVIRLVLDHPGITRIVENEFGTGRTARRIGTRITLRDYLSSAGWSRKRIRQTFREIGEIIS